MYPVLCWLLVFALHLVPTVALGGGRCPPLLFEGEEDHRYWPLKHRLHMKAYPLHNIPLSPGR